MIEPGSFRDPDTRVFYESGRVLRGLGGRAAAADTIARDAGLMDRLVGRGLFIENWVVEDVDPPPGAPAEVIVESRRLPLVSYSSEWSFDMLREAALVTLEANLIALESGFILKDASAFNVLFDGEAPRVIDVSSIEAFGESGIWTAYGQFCDHFLSPLMLEAYAGMTYQEVLRGRVDGLPIGDLNRMLRGRAGLHRGVMTHVRLRGVLDRRAEGMDTESREDVARTALPRETVAATIRKTMKLVAGLQSSAPSVWADYEKALPYRDEAVEAKSAFVRRAAGATAGRGMALDVGANAGHFTRILADHFEYVVGIDTDPGAIDALFHTVKKEGVGALTPLVVDITNPTPGFGWRSRERSAFLDRVRPSFANWLAVVHHLCLGQGIPLRDVVALIYEVSDQAVVEFVDADDPMARHISATRTIGPLHYSREDFEAFASLRGSVRARHEVSETRTLYHLAKA